MKPSICILGCGEHAKRVLSEKDYSQEFNLYFASHDKNKAKTYSDKYKGLDYFESYSKALSDKRIDAAYFLTPHNVHLSNVQLAAKNGIHVLIEKPIARNLEEAHAMISEAHANNVKLMIAENYRYLPTIKSVKEILDAGIIGNMISIEIESKDYNPVYGWRLDKDLTGGGRFIDGGIHYIDILLNLGGLPTRLYAQAAQTRLPNIQAEDTVIMIANLPNGVIGLINHCTAAPQNTRQDNVLISGTIKQLSFNPFGNEILVTSKETQEKIKLDKGGAGFKEMLDDFRQYIMNSSHKPIMTNEAALNDLVVVLASYESMSTSISVTPKFVITQ